MAHTKSQRATRGNRESRAKRLGVKVYGGTTISTGQIIVRQRGTSVRPGIGVGRGGDDTLFALQSGKVKFSKRQGKKYVNVDTL